MVYDLLIKDGTIITDSQIYKSDIGIISEKIHTISENIPKENGKKIINAKNKYIIPGGIDVHVHLQLPFCGTVSSDDFISGTMAAARGGVTTIIDFATQDKEKGIMYGVDKRKAEADGKVCVDYGLHSVLLGWNENTAREMPKAIENGIASFKMFMIYESEGWQSTDSALFQALEKTKENGAFICIHAESESVMKILINRYLKDKKQTGAYGHVLSRPNYIEQEAVQRAVLWTEKTGGRLYIVHTSTGEAVEIIKSAKNRGVSVYAETCPHYLLLDESVFKDKKTGHLYATCPQIKSKNDQEKLWNALSDGNLQVVSTDTCTFTKKQKDMWKGDFTKIPYGLPGTEIMIPSVYTFGVLKNRFGLNKFVSLISTNPAKLMGLYPQKGTIMPGSDADLAIFDPKKKKKIDFKELSTNCDWSPYQNMIMAGFPEYTLLRGSIIVENGNFIGKPGSGKFIKRKTWGKL